MTFLRELLAVILGVFISFFIMFLVFLAIGSVISSRFMDDGTVRVKENSVLVLNLDKNIRDFAPKSDDPLAALLGIEEDKIGLNSIINAIDNAKYDDNILGISIESLLIRGGLAQTQEIRDKLFEFKESGKFITAYADVYEGKNYYLSSVADSLYMNPEGMLEFNGLSGEVLYFKDFQDKYGIRMEVVRHGKYKSAVEPFLDNKMSEENREQVMALLNSLWEEILTDVEEHRKIPGEELNRIADDLLTRTPQLARDNGMLTSLLYRDQYDEKLKELARLGEGQKLNRISIDDYVDSGKGRITSVSGNKIAVIYAQGEMLFGKGDETFIGQDLIRNSLKKAREDKDVKAIVLRVNSPGGVFITADIIARELDITKQEKPLIASMGNLAASGGYYIACSADKIVAQPTTITGSIGVFATLPNISGFVDRIGINAEQFGTHRQSVGYSIFEPMSEEVYAVSKERIEGVYSSFLNQVASGRNMTLAQVDSVAQGRIWTGKQALELGLVDELGSLEDAVRLAADAAGIEEYRIRNYPDYDKEFKDMFKGPFASVKEELLRAELGEENLEIYKRLKSLGNWSGVQARLPFLMEID